MFNQPTPPQRAFRPTKPPTDEPEDILNEVEHDTPPRPQMSMPPKPAPAPSLRPMQVNVKKVAPPPELEKVSAPMDKQPPKEAPKVKDIFSQIDTNPNEPGIPAGLKIKEPPTAAEPMEETERRGPLLRSKVLLTIILAVLGVGVLGVAGYFIYNQLFVAKTLKNNSTATNVNNANIEANTNLDANVNTRPTVSQTPPPPTPPERSIDTDLDGLSDADEKLYGTKPNNPDTDGDGLSDKDEVKIWKTDPLDVDSDGDGYNDGDEVKNKYNPLGPGRLIEIPK